jgi:hypothetical protein
VRYIEAFFGDLTWNEVRDLSERALMRKGYSQYRLFLFRFELSFISSMWHRHWSMTYKTSRYSQAFLNSLLAGYRCDIVSEALCLFKKNLLKVVDKHNDINSLWALFYYCCRWIIYIYNNISIYTCTVWSHVILPNIFPLLYELLSFGSVCIIYRYVT